jgi:hypothetical protein
MPITKVKSQVFDPSNSNASYAETANTDIYGEDNSPYGAVSADYWTKVQQIEQETVLSKE